ncbi:MAG: family 31 glucosidase [Treponemataceae bacterium]|nr:family 31 glucosidase [Treponemataceae bacterium]
MIEKSGNTIIFRKGNEILKIEPWGTDSLRVRATMNPRFSDTLWGLTEPVEASDVQITLHAGGAEGAVITNGKVSAGISANGVLTFFKDGRQILKEYNRFYDQTASRETCCLKVVQREWKGLRGGDYKLTVRFNPNDGEKLFGMGQYGMPCLDVKGCTLELAQRNGQVSIPFVLSSLGYGFLWNNPGVGRATFGTNVTEWFSECLTDMDYWITAGDTPADIVRNYTAAVGRAPVLDDSYLGFWQCKLRYRTQAEVLAVARKYRELGIHLDVIVIDFFHWIRQGDWGFDSDYWPDPKAMCDELHAMGTKVMVSIWPSVDKKSIHYAEMKDRGLLVRVERGSLQTYDFQGDCLTFDATNPEAREYIWQIAKKSYVDYGIDMFWLDNAEPDYSVYDWENYRYWLGPALACTNIYPKYYNQAFYDGMKAMGKTSIVNLTRSGWVGSQKLGAVLWNGDVQSTWECLRDSVAQGLNMGICGFPWWNTDIGGFMWGNVESPAFHELLIRWAQFAVWSPIMRLHGDRDPHDTPQLCADPQQDYGGGYLFTGRPNEIWSYGEAVQKALTAQIALRQSLRPYLAELSREAAETGAPVMRTMFWQFPEDETCWNLRDQYMFGSRYLVAPVLESGCTERQVYLPAGQWRLRDTENTVTGGQWITVPVTLDAIPVFQRIL